MFNIKLGEKVYNIRFEYEATYKSGIIRKLVANQSRTTEEKVDNAFGLLPEMLLVGLQAEHKDEFGYNVDNKTEWEARLHEAYTLLDIYLSSEEGDFFELYTGLEEEMTNNGFLSSLFRMEKKKSEQKKTTKKN